MPFSSWRNENWNEHSLIRSSFSSLSSSHHRPISGSESHSAEGMWRELMQPFSVIEKQAVRAENEGEWCGGGEAIALAGIWTGEVILPLKCVEGFSQQVLTMRINRDQTKQSMQTDLTEESSWVDSTHKGLLTVACYVSCRGCDLHQPYAHFHTRTRLSQPGSTMLNALFSVHAFSFTHQPVFSHFWDVHSTSKFHRSSFYWANPICQAR